MIIKIENQLPVRKQKELLKKIRKDQKISRISVEFILYLTQHRWKVYHLIKIRIKNIAFDEEKYEIPLSVMNDFCENTDLKMIER